MRSDLYTKAALTAIVILLAVIALKLPITQPQVNPKAETDTQTALPSGLQFAYAGNDHYAFFDSRTGEIWEYVGFSSRDYSGNDQLVYKYHLVSLGKPLTEEYNKYTK
jgi:hypothetical protein